MSDPLGLQPGERVLWAGRSPIGSSPPRQLSALGAWAGGLFALVAGILVVGTLASVARGQGAGEGPTVLAGISAAAVAVLVVGALVLALGRLVGPSYAELACVLVFGSGGALAWLVKVARAGGWTAALDDLHAHEALGAVVLVGLPLARVILVASRRAGRTLVVTTARVLLLRGESIVDSALVPDRVGRTRPEVEPRTFGRSELRVGPLRVELPTADALAILAEVERPA